MGGFFSSEDSGANKMSASPLRSSPPFDISIEGLSLADEAAVPCKPSLSKPLKPKALPKLQRPLSCQCAPKLPAPTERGGSGWGLHFYSQKEWEDGRKVVSAVMTTSPRVDGRNTTWWIHSPPLSGSLQLSGQFSVPCPYQLSQTKTGVSAQS